MKFKIELEFVVDESLKYNSGFAFNEDGSENNDIVSMARYALSMNLLRYQEQICKHLGFPGYFTLEDIKEIDD